MISTRLFLSLLFLFLFLSLPLKSIFAQIKPAAVTEEKEEVMVMLAQPWRSGMDVKGWLMSEKYDGVRGYWNGKKLLTRSGNTLRAPLWFTKGLPPFPLDGELWIGPNKFSDTSGILSRNEPGEGWKKIKFRIFDAPEAKGGIEARLEAIEKWLKEHPSDFIELVGFERCRGEEHLKKELARVEARGGEGLMLRKPGSLYEKKRSSSLLKVKSYEEGEGVVVGYKPGKGKNKGKMGSLVLELDDGKRLSVGTGFTTKERLNPPPVGAVVTFKYRGLTKKGLPRFASFKGSRIDLKKK